MHLPRVERNNGWQIWRASAEVLPRIPDLFPTVENVEWDEERITCTLRVALEPERDYQLYLDAPGTGNFASEEGIWLRPVILWFHTRAAEASVEVE